MRGPSEAGKGDDRRPESSPGNYDRGYEGIDWSAREREAEEPAECPTSST